MTNAWSPGKNPKRTKIGKGKHSKFKALGSNGKAPKGYRKKNRGQGKQ